MRLLFLFITIAVITAWLFSKKLKLFNESFFNFIMFLVLGIISIVSYIYSNNDNRSFFLTLSIVGFTLSLLYLILGFKRKRV